MGETRLEPTQTFRCLVGFLWIARCLDRVAVEAVGQRMVDVELQDGVQGGDEFLRSGLRFALRRPLVPGPKIHQRFDAQVGRAPAAVIDPRRSRWVIHPFTGRKVRVADDAR